VPAERAASPLVLIVEDNPANLMLAEVVLARGGFKTVAAPSAEEARDVLLHTRPDLILMDVQLPGEDGLSCTRRLKADPATAAIPIVALTAHAMAADRERALAAGCRGCITKPIDTRTFAAQVAGYLGRHPADSPDAAASSGAAGA
jgi:two-component system cell cycle response regulator DivK